MWETLLRTAASFPWEQVLIRKPNPDKARQKEAPVDRRHLEHRAQELARRVHAGEITRDAAIEELRHSERHPSVHRPGEACTICGKDHFSTIAGGLAEAMRFARDGGIDHPEVFARIAHCEDELNAFERWDGSPEKVAELPPDEKSLMDDMLIASRNLRHRIATVTSIETLEQAAVEAKSKRQEFGTKLFRLARKKLKQKDEEASHAGA